MNSYFEIALSLREAMFINGILTNVEIWYGLTKTEIEELQLVDRLLLRRIVSLPSKTCNEALYLESGCQDIDTIVKGRRVKYLHYLANYEKEGMLYKFFKAQWNFPARGDWVVQCREDLRDFELPSHLEYFEGKSKAAFKRIMDKKCKQFALDKFNELKSLHSKMKNLHYDDLKLQKYLKLKELTVEESKHLLLWRLRMTNFGKNYGDGDKLCPACHNHEDSQEKIFECDVMKKSVKIDLKYSEIFSLNPSKELVNILMKIMKIRENEP